MLAKIKFTREKLESLKLLPILGYQRVSVDVKSYTKGLAPVLQPMIALGMVQKC